MKVVAIVPAAGTGERLPGPEKKQYLLLAGVPVLIRTLYCLERSFRIDSLVAIVPEEDLVTVREELIPAYGLRKVRAVVAGGDTRQESVARGLRAATSLGDWDLVLVHDGVRPFLSLELIEATVNGAMEDGAAAAALFARDTVRLVDGAGAFADTLPRERVVLMQTPQVFRPAILKEALERARADGFVATDDAALVERLGFRVLLVPGSPENIKITTPEDLKFAEALAKGYS